MWALAHDVAPPRRLLAQQAVLRHVVHADEQRVVHEPLVLKVLDVTSDVLDYYRPVIVQEIDEFLYSL